MRLELSSRYFSWAHHPMARERCLGVTTNVSPRNVVTQAHLWASHCWSFSFFCRSLWVTLCSSPQMPVCGKLTMKLRWGLQDFCLVVTNFQVWVIMQAHLDTLSQVMVLGDAKKSWWDIAFLLIVLSIATEHERIFSLITVWAHLCQAHYTTLAYMACKLVLPMDSSAAWLYAFVQLNEVLSHTPLSSMGHISAMTYGAPSTGPCSWHHQFQVHELTV